MKAIRKRNRDSTERLLKAAVEKLKQTVIKVTIVGVAKEAGVTPALIHNKYPEIAEQIRKTIGKSTRDRLHEKNRLLIVERARNRELRAERDALFQEVRDLASENEALRRELVIQQAIAEGSVTRLPVHETVNR
jgi:AcrR family transcriptional regulator